MFFTLAKKPIYANYEILVNVFNTKSIDLSEVKIYDLDSAGMSKTELEKYLYASNEYTREKFILRARWVKELRNIVEKQKKTKEDELKYTAELKKSMEVPTKEKTNT